MAGLAAARLSGGGEFHEVHVHCRSGMREGAFSEHGSQQWCHVLAAGSRSQASTCCCAAGRTNDVFEIRRASASVYSVHDRT